MAALSPASDSCSVNQGDNHLPLSSDEDQFEDQQLGLERAKEFIVWTVGKITDTFKRLIENGVMSNAEVLIVLITVTTLTICYAILDEETDNCDEESNIDSDESDQHIESEEENSYYYDEGSVSNPNEYCEGRSTGQQNESDEDMEEVPEYRGIEGAKSALEKVLSSMMSSTMEIINMHRDSNMDMDDSEDESDDCVIFTCTTCVCTLAAFYTVLLAEEEEDDSEEASDEDTDESSESASDVENILEDEQKDVIEKNAGEISETVSSSSRRPPIPTSPQRVIGSNCKRNADDENSVGLVSEKRRRT